MEVNLDVVSGSGVDGVRSVDVDVETENDVSGGGFVEGSGATGDDGGGGRGSRSFAEGVGGC